MTNRVSMVFGSGLTLMILSLIVLWLAPVGPMSAWRRWTLPPAQVPNFEQDIKSVMLKLNGASNVAYPQIDDRPLFVSSRRPKPIVEAEPANVASPISALDQIKLRGIMAGETLTGAFVEEAEKPRFIARGEKVGNWTLSEVDDRAVIFQSGDKIRRIELESANLKVLSNEKGKNVPRAPIRTQIRASIQTNLSLPSFVAPAASTIPPNSTANGGNTSNDVDRSNPEQEASDHSTEQTQPKGPRASFGGRHSKKPESEN